MSLFIVTIGADTFEVYAGLVDVTKQINGMRSAGATAFRALSSDDQARTLNDVTSYIDRYSWQGTADAAGGTTLQFPRSGLVDATGAVIDDATQLATIAKAVGQLCALAAAKPSILTAVDTGNNVKRADAGGGAGVEFFNPTSAKLGTATVLPQAIQQLLGAWLSSSGSGAQGGEGQSGRSTSSFAHCRRYDRDGAF